MRTPSPVASGQWNTRRRGTAGDGKQNRPAMGGSRCLPRTRHEGAPGWTPPGLARAEPAVSAAACPSRASWPSGLADRSGRTAVGCVTTARPSRDLLPVPETGVPRGSARSTRSEVHRNPTLRRCRRLASPIRPTPEFTCGPRPPRPVVIDTTPDPSAPASDDDTSQKTPPATIRRLPRRPSIPSQPPPSHAPPRPLAGNAHARASRCRPGR